MATASAERVPTRKAAEMPPPMLMRWSQQSHPDEFAGLTHAPPRVGLAIPPRPAFARHSYAHEVARADDRALVLGFHDALLV